MHSTWIGPDGELAVAGAFGDVAMHHHPAVQVGVGLDGPLELTTADGVIRNCRAVVIASGTRHALGCADGVTPMSLYLRPETAPGAAINARAAGGVWIADDDLSDCIATVFAEQGLEGAARRLIGELIADTPPQPGHPQLKQAVDLVRADPANPADIVTIARAVALSPDYLGRLFKKQTGTSFSATTRWIRLLAGMEYLHHGGSVTDAAHSAGFTDGAHANRACWEMLGGSPRDLARALSE
ncbi:AraC-like DNA-binding protein [Mycolicibacterium sp. BK634]|uniref:helix-turn-helix domain-containing protein n=1 Tax=Mycolicibacterium sp. BK634 TaxID=2587099 RepID=UPI001620E6DF|nr:AraC-like DNA-binding protein [Mycolicibacterium sp. BK634]